MTTYFIMKFQWEGGNKDTRKYKTLFDTADTHNETPPSTTHH